MGELWSIIQGHLDKYGVREAEFARRMGTSPQTLNSWKNRGLKALPTRTLLAAVAEQAHVPYGRVLNAALHDIGYIGGHPSLAQDHSMPQSTPEVEAVGAPAGTKEDWELARLVQDPEDVGRDTDGRAINRAYSTLGEESQDPGDGEPA